MVKSIEANISEFDKEHSENPWGSRTDVWAIGPYIVELYVDEREERGAVSVHKKQGDREYEAKGFQIFSSISEAKNNVNSMVNAKEPEKHIQVFIFRYGYNFDQES